MATRSLLIVVLAACGSPPNPECSNPGQCNLAAGGMCAVSTEGHSWCLYPYATCPSGNRWSPEAGDGLSGECKELEPTATLTVTLPGNGSGTVTSTPAGIACGSVCSASFPIGTPVTLDIATNADSVFQGWLGGGASCGFAPGCTVTLANDTTVDALFALAGTTLWATQVGAAGSERVSDVAVAPTGDVYIAGTFDGDLTFGGRLLVNQGSNDIFIAKLSGTDGSVLWVRELGGSGTDSVRDVAVDEATGDVVVTGRFSGTVDFGGPAPLAGGGTYLARYTSSDGSYGWARQIVGSQTSLLVGVSGATVLVGGWFEGSIDVGDGSITSTGQADVIAAGYSLASGAYQWKATYGQAGALPFVEALAVDGAGNLLLAGTLYGTISFGSRLLTATTPGNDAFLVKLNGTNGSTIWANRYGGAENDAFYGVDAGPQNDVLVLGETTLGMDLGGGASVAAAGLVVARLDTLGQGEWAKLATITGGNQTARAIVASPDRVVVAGGFRGTETLGGMSVTSVGSYDAFVGSLSFVDGSTTWLQRFGGIYFSDVLDADVDPVSSRVLVGGSFSTFTQFGDEELTALGSGDGFCVAIVPRP